MAWNGEFWNICLYVNAYFDCSHTSGYGIQTLPNVCQFSLEIFVAVSPCDDSVLARVDKPSGPRESRFLNGIRFT